MTDIRARAAAAADWLAAGIAASLPISTSVTSVLVALWLCALAPTVDVSALRREALHPAAALGLALCAFAALGLLWADVAWPERLHGLSPYAKLLVIAPLLFQFRRSGRWWLPAAGFLAGASFILAWSYYYAYWPGLWWRGKEFGVPVKDYITQSGAFVICIFGLAETALVLWRRGRRGLALAAAALALAFFCNITFVTSGRTALVVLPVLALLLAFRHFGGRGVIVLVAFGGMLALALWNSSPYLRGRVVVTLVEAQAYGTTTAQTSTGQRLEFWKKSLGFIATAPVLGHGTGSIRDQFAKAARGTQGPSMLVSTNPHQQLMAVAIQLGLVGAALLAAMWGAHGLLFRGPGLVAWLGLVIVTQNVVGSLFNSHLFDFTQGWIYVIGVGVFGGAVRRDQPPDSAR